MPVFRIQNYPDAEGNFPISEQDFKHINLSLRIKIGESFQVYLPDGTKAKAILLREPPDAQGQLVHRLDHPTPSPIPLWVGMGIIRWSRMEWLIEKITELGVERFTPLLLNRSRHPRKEAVSPNKINRLNKISQEALKQCERGTGLVLDPPQSLEAWLLQTSQPRDGSTKKIIFNEGLQYPRLNLSDWEGAQNFVLLIGPEGGFAPEELTQAHQAGFQSFCLGPAKLRSETAALYGASILNLMKGVPE